MNLLMTLGRSRLTLHPGENQSGQSEGRNPKAEVKRLSATVPYEPEQPH